MNEIIWNDEQNQFIMMPSGKVDKYKYYLIQIKSCNFSGENDFCIPLDTIEKNLNMNIKELLVGDVILLDDFDSDSYIKFTILDTLGKVTVNGK